MQRKESGGFTLVEILVALVVIAILAAIAIANYVTGLQRARQKRTMADMRTIASAWEARATEVKGYSAGGFSFPGQAATYTELREVLVPTYANPLPERDGWDTAFQFATNEAWGTQTAQSYAIRSAGSDKSFDSNNYAPGEVQKFDCDIVYANGSFVTYPSR